MKASSGYILATMIWLLVSVVSFAQTSDTLSLYHTEKHDNIFSPTNITKIESNCQNKPNNVGTNPKRRKVAAVRTNLLVPLSNIGVEVCLNTGWSVGADYYFPWLIRKADHKNAIQLLGWGLEGRYWFGKERKETDRLKGHSIGLSSYAGYYDFERNYSGIQGEFINIGVDYLYALSLCKERLHLEFNIGLGYIYSNVTPYDVFEEGGKAFKEGYIKKFHWVGPVKAGVSLAVPIYATKK